MIIRSKTEEADLGKDRGSARHSFRVTALNHHLVICVIHFFLKQLTIKFMSQTLSVGGLIVILGGTFETET
jgi:hypothetical protein